MELFGGKNRKKMRRIFINLTGFVLVLFSILGCVSEGGKEGSENESYDFKFPVSCDSVSGLGVGFNFPKNLQIDSASCIKNNTKEVDANLFKNEEANRIQIYDTFLYKNEYKLLLFSNGISTSFSVRNIVFKPKHVYRGEVCSIFSCEFNNAIIKDDGGIFKITSSIIEK
ncbi:hypothetical protein [Fluviicola sp.]|uniref:hypothetical protein n=1 Tax=Fluviicola sp. TaxID=1917219 RepID=UPI002617F4A4|nr:hypothetical protein [Fluviicola sp.]